MNAGPEGSACRDEDWSPPHMTSVTDREGFEA